MLAVIRGHKKHKEVVSFLLKKGANPNDINAVSAYIHNNFAYDKCYKQKMKQNSSVLNYIVQFESFSLRIWHTSVYKYANSLVYYIITVVVVLLWKLLHVYLQSNTFILHTTEETHRYWHQLWLSSGCPALLSLFQYFNFSIMANSKELGNLQLSLVEV